MTAAAHNTPNQTCGRVMMKPPFELSAAASTPARTAPLTVPAEAWPASAPRGMSVARRTGTAFARRAGARLARRRSAAHVSGTSGRVGLRSRPLVALARADLGDALRQRHLEPGRGLGGVVEVRQCDPRQPPPDSPLDVAQA